MEKPNYDRFVGKDNYGKPKSEYLDEISNMTNEELHKETRKKIWLSAYANNNPRSDYHWHVDALYEEWGRRGIPEGYNKAYQEEYHANFG
jgi:hypothetical protein